MRGISSKCTLLFDLFRLWWSESTVIGLNPLSGPLAKAAAFASMSHPQGAIEQFVWRSGLSLSLFPMSSLKKKFGRSETNLCFFIESLPMISSTGPVRKIRHVNLIEYLIFFNLNDTKTSTTSVESMQ
jgi:hypothetical protein